MLFHMIAENTKFLETFSDFFVVKQKFQKLSDRNFLKVLFFCEKKFYKVSETSCNLFFSTKVVFETSFHVLKHLQRSFKKNFFVSKEHC